MDLFYKTALIVKVWMMVILSSSHSHSIDIGTMHQGMIRNETVSITNMKWLIGETRENPDFLLLYWTHTRYY